MNPEAVITDDGVFWLYACLVYFVVLGYLIWEDMR
jgi:hypothetical protein